MQTLSAMADRIIGVPPVVDRHRRRHGVGEPRIAPADADQPLDQAIHPLPRARQIIRRCGERRPHRVIAAHAVLLDAAKRLLVAVIDARHPADGEQHVEQARHANGEDGEQHGHRKGGSGTSYTTGNACHVMVADERLRRERLQKLIVPFEAPIQFIEVRGFERTPNRLPQLVLGE